MMDHKGNILATCLVALLDGIQENIICHGFHDFLSRCLLEVMGFLLCQDLAIITLYLLKKIGCCVITQLKIKEHLHYYIHLFSYPNLTWKVSLLVPYNTLLVRLVAYMGPSLISLGESSIPLIIS